MLETDFKEPIYMSTVQMFVKHNLIKLEYIIVFNFSFYVTPILIVTG